jgi:thymidylate synthase
MKVITARNVHSALHDGLDLMQSFGIKRDSRNGPVYQVMEPVATVYQRPAERVMFHPWRDANPFFHFYESLWMLAGRNDIAPLVRYVKRMGTFSDDGETQNAAYGYRWRHANPYNRDPDQLGMIIEGLKKNPECRRQVLQIWNCDKDLGTGTKDAACNIAATFQINHKNQLDMSVFCRSNDIIWGCYGANAVHFSMLMEYVASGIGVPMGEYTQISVNWHAYEEIYEKMLTTRTKKYQRDVPVTPYDAEVGEDVGRFRVNAQQVRPYPIMTVPRDLWDLDCSAFVTADGRLPNATRDYL